MEQFSLVSPVSEIPLEELDDEDRDEVIFTDECEELPAGMPEGLTEGMPEGLTEGLTEGQPDRRPNVFPYNLPDSVPYGEYNDFSGAIIEGFSGGIYNENTYIDGEEECLQRQMSFRCLSEGDEENILNNV